MTRPRIVVAGLGPAGPDMVPPHTVTAIRGARRSFLRTRWHPAAAMFPEAESFDQLYDAAESFDGLYADMRDRLIAEAKAADGRFVAYAVPGSPLIAERSVELLRNDPRVEVEILPAMSFLDLAWERLRIDPLELSVRLIDGARFATAAAGDRGPVLVAQCWSKEILSEVKLSIDLAHPDTTRVTVLQRLGCADEKVVDVAWEELDRAIEPDHMTSLFIPTLVPPVAAELVALEELVRTLRAECPWDRKQTHASLTKHLIEEAYEVLDAISGLSTLPETEAFAHLEEELGDLLFQVLFHSRLAAEEGHFDLSDVARHTRDKLVARHPHVFGDVVAETAEAVMSNWEQIKKEEKGRSSLMEGIPSSLPALALAFKVQKKAASVGFDWPDPSGPRAKLDEEASELDRAVTASGPNSPEASKELGDLLFSVVNLARHWGMDPEICLRDSAQRFRGRFQYLEARAEEEGRPLGAMTLEEMDAHWEKAKQHDIGEQ